MPKEESFMRKEGSILLIIVIFVSVMYEIVMTMISDENPILRFLGYITAIVTAVGVLVFVLYLFMDINILNLK